MTNKKKSLEFCFPLIQCFFGGNIDQSVTAPSSNRKVASSIALLCIPTGGGAAQWIRAQVCNRKVVGTRFGS